MSTAAEIYNSRRALELLPLGRKLDMPIIELHGVMKEDGLWAPTEAPADATPRDVLKYSIQVDTRLEVLRDILSKNPKAADEIIKR